MLCVWCLKSSQKCLLFNNCSVFEPVRWKQHLPSSQEGSLENNSGAVAVSSETDNVQPSQMSVLRCCWVIDSSPLMFNLVEPPLTSQTEDADSWQRDGLGQTPLLTLMLWFTSHQRHMAQHGHTCVQAQTQTLQTHRTASVHGHAHTRSLTIEHAGGSQTLTKVSLAH